MKILRPTYAEINLENIKYNVGIIKKFIGGDVEILAVIKADAYGHGAIKVAKALENTAVKIFGVATIEEGIELRTSGIKKDILILGSVYPFSNFSEIIKYNLIPTIASISGIEFFNKFAKYKNKKLPLHLKIETGMGRLGVLSSTAISLIKKIKNLKNIYIDGIYSHLACAVENENFTEKQIHKFSNGVQLDEKLFKKIPIKYKHIAASASIIKYKDSHFNLVRPGLLIYGLLPFENSDSVVGVKSALSLKTKIIFLKKVPKNTSISYCRTFITNKISKIATIPIGYADGFLRVNSNPSTNCLINSPVSRQIDSAQMIVRGKKVPVVGRVCMDMTMIDVTDVKNVAIGDEVVIIGYQGKEKITVEDVAKRTNTINYEIVTSISKRIPRIYTRL
ncbi:MAG: alanine racemase [Elusimicrobiota bacterium]